MHFWMCVCVCVCVCACVRMCVQKQVRERKNTTKINERSIASCRIFQNDRHCYNETLSEQSRRIRPHHTHRDIAKRTCRDRHRLSDAQEHHRAETARERKSERENKRYKAMREWIGRAFIKCCNTDRTKWSPIILVRQRIKRARVCARMYVCSILLVILSLSHFCVEHLGIYIYG